MATGVGAFGVDGVGQHADDGIKQLALAFDEVARFDGHRQGAREFFDKSAEVPLALAPVLHVAQHQQAQGLAAARAQLHAQHLQGQCSIWRAWCGQHIVQRVLGVVDEVRHAQLLGVQRLVLRVGAVTGSALQVGAVAIDQVHRAAAANAGLHQLVQHAGEHHIQARLGTDMAADAQKIFDGGGHAVHHQPQLAHLAHGGGAALGTAKIKQCQRLRLGRQATEAAAHTPPGYPPQWQQQADQAQ